MIAGRRTLFALLALDALAVFGVFNVVSMIRGVGAEGHLILLPLLAPYLAVVFALYLIDGYKPRTDMISLDYTSLHAIALVSALVATLLLTFVLLPGGYELQSSRVVITMSYVVLIPLTLSYRRVVYLRVVRRRGTRGLVFVGIAADCEAFREDCSRMESTQNVVYAVTSFDGEPAGAPFAGHTTALDGVLKDVRQGRLDIEAIVFRETSRELPPESSQMLVELYFRGVPTYTLELFHQVYWRKIPLYRINQTWLFQEGFRIAREPVFERLKRVTDIGFALVGLTLTAPFVLLGAIAVWLEDGRPFFYTQMRIGRNRVPFRVRKLRSMRRASGDGDPYTRHDDQRVTRVGRFLRATRIDEFPQLWNVLRGEMSLIGPRAEWDRLVATYEHEIPCYHFRHLVRPGITGWAQVNYPYGAGIDDTLRKLEYDLYYIRHFSFTLDASILLKTIHVILFGKGR